MALSKEIYKAFEDIVGPQYICDDPAIMPAYYQTKFAAVILPKKHCGSSGDRQIMQQA